MKKYNVNLIIQIGKSGTCREPEFVVEADNSTEAAILAVLKAKVADNEALHSIHIGRGE